MAAPRLDLSPFCPAFSFSMASSTEGSNCKGVCGSVNVMALNEMVLDVSVMWCYMLGVLVLGVMVLGVIIKLLWCVCGR